jgi:RecB family exonuclease
VVRLEGAACTNSVIAHPFGMPFAGTQENNEAELPSRLSPSRLSDFKQCPAKFYFGSVCKLPRYATEATTVGSLAHEAFERIFDHPRGERTPELAVTYVRPAWERLKGDPNYDLVRDLGDELVERAEHMVRSWFGMEDPNKFDPTGRELRLTVELDGVQLLGIIDRVDELEVQGEQRVYISDYKGLALDTPLPTPTGWTTMGKVQVGDQLLAANGTPVTVTEKSGVHHRPCYEVVFADGSVIVADNVHLWGVMTDMAYDVVTTEGLRERLMQKRRVFVPRRSALSLPFAGIDIDATVAWFGEGCPAGGSQEARRSLRASLAERVQVITALCEEHGALEEEDGFAMWCFAGVSKEAAAYLAELAATMSYPCETAQNGDSWYFEMFPEVLEWEVDEVRPVQSVHTQCVKVDSPAALYLAGEAMIVTHNTGKVPAENDRFLDEKFFAMRAYAMLWNELHGSVPHELRLVYVAGGDRSAVRRKSVDEKLLKATKKQLRDMIREIKSCAKSGEWECRKQALCQWCDFIDVCPLYHPELGGLPVGEIKAQFGSGALSD